MFREVFAMTDLHHANIVRYSTSWVEIDNEKSSRIFSDNVAKIYKSQIEPKGITEESESHSESESNLESQYTKSSCVGFEWENNEKSSYNNKTLSHLEDSKKQDNIPKRKARENSIKSVSNVTYSFLLVYLRL